MMTLFRVGGAAAAVLAAASIAFGQTAVRPKAGGDRILFVDGNDIRPEPGGKRLLFVDGSDVRPEPDGKRLLFVDNDGNVRHDPAGVRLAYFDKSDNTLRRKPGGKILVWAKHPEIREDNAGGKLLYFLDGPALGRTHLVALLHHLKPDTFQLSDDEMAALKAERDAAAKEEENRVANRFLGNFSVLNSNLDYFKKSKVTVTPTKGYFTVTIEVPDGKLTGIGVGRKVGTDDEIWLAVGTKGDMKLGIFEAAGQELDGTWFPAAGLADDKLATGTEKLKPGKPGIFQFTAKAPKTGAETKGTVQVRPVKDPDSGNDVQSFALQWTIDKEKAKPVGVGIQVNAPKGGGFMIATGTDPSFMVGRLLNTNSSGVHIDFFSNGGKAGYILLDK